MTNWLKVKVTYREEIEYVATVEIDEDEYREWAQGEDDENGMMRRFLRETDAEPDVWLDQAEKQKTLATSEFVGIEVVSAEVLT